MRTRRASGIALHWSSATFRFLGLDGARRQTFDPLQNLRVHKVLRTNWLANGNVEGNVELPWDTTILHESSNLKNTAPTLQELRKTVHADQKQ